MTKPAFAADANVHAVASTAKALWWGVNGVAARALVRPAASPPKRPVSDQPAPSEGLLRRRWLEAFSKDRADVAAGLYPLSEAAPSGPMTSFARSLDLLRDAREVDARRRREDGTEVRTEPAAEALPTYYQQNFHYQSGGWLTAESAARYEGQVELLFAGAAGAMRRRALSLLMKHWRDSDQRDLRVVDLACGSGAFLRDLTAALPRASVAGLDLSGPYLAEARARSGAPTVQANVERLPFADASLDGLTCVFLFHELPPRVRPLVAAEMARVLKPRGVLAFADSVQASDEPELARMLDAFPVFFHEPYYASYQSTDLPALFAGAGLTLKGQDSAFLTKAMLFEKHHPNSSI